MSLNDPQWGNRGSGDDDKPDGGGRRRPNQGPPDLEELWRDFNRKLNGLFGKKGGGSGNNGGGGDGPRLPQINFNPKFLGGGIRFLHRRCLAARHRSTVREIQGNRVTGTELAFSVSDPVARTGQPDRRAHA